MTELILLAATGEIRVQPQYVSLDLLQDWLKTEVIDKQVYVRLAVWLITSKQPLSVDVDGFAENLSTKEMQVSAQDVKRAIFDLKQRQICSVKNAQLSLW